MHSNPEFRRTEHAKSLDAARACGMGALTINGTQAPLVCHIPFLINPEGTQVGAHLTRSNAILRALDAPKPALLMVTLGQAYISPDWYGAPDQVPTLNYIAIHLRGSLRRLDEAALRPHLDALSAHFEAQKEGPPWTADKMTGEVLARMMRMIVPVALEIEEVESTWKLNQNKTEAQRRGAADHVSDPVIQAAMRAL